VLLIGRLKLEPFLSEAKILGVAAADSVTVLRWIPSHQSFTLLLALAEKLRL
jgi:hypothetical protein